MENLNLEGLPARGARVTVAPTALRGAPEAGSFGFRGLGFRDSFFSILVAGYR